ncbi:MAG: pyridoxine 5'-phosphate synthase, partial [Chitinispirillaceae bacterium]|nr:pyridoxine 5'-phosphate synthase [Chitinispirillaceae bacterium]
MAKLGVNIDHIATIRQARGGRDPDPVQAAVIAELAGANGITAHLREDRRHIQDRDIYLLKQVVTTHLNMEMAPTQEIINIVKSSLPDSNTKVKFVRIKVGRISGVLPDTLKFCFDSIVNQT